MPQTHCWSAALAARWSLTLGETNEQFRSARHSSRTSTRVCSIGADVSPFRAIWAQWDKDGKPPADQGIYLQAEAALKQALGTLGETDIVAFARSRNVERYAAALGEAIRRTEL